jgi:PPOX class probable FMN-dependent enzyme
MAYRDHLITTMDQLQSLYGEKMGASVVKEIDHINDGYRKLIEVAPFVAVATAGPEGLDCSPKGDAPGFVRILDDKTLAIPDRPGNNRIDGFRNIIRDPRIALLFLIPGVGETLRVNGRASISIDPELMQSFAVSGKLPRCVLIVHVESIYFHCSKAIVRSKLWEETTKVDRRSLPSTGTIIAELSKGKLGGETYDREAPERIKAQLY